MSGIATERRAASQDAWSAPAPRVLMVTGAYHPEVSGAGLQARTLVHALRDRVSFAVLTTCTDPALPAVDEVEGTPVYRVIADAGRLRSDARVARALVARFLRLRHQVDVVHLHGFSRKSALLLALARLCGKPVVLKLTSAGHDDPASMRARGGVAYRLYRRADLFVGVSPRLRQLYDAAGFPPEQFRLIPNGVDLQRFRPPESGERRALRHALGLPERGPLVLFVGFFSREKAPDVLFGAWSRLVTDGGPSSGLVFVGATRATYWEIEPGLAERIRDASAQHAEAGSVVFVERTHEIEKYYRAVDVFVLPSVREGLPNALLEAMGSGLPCVASRLPGVTDAVIEDGVDGLLVPPGDPAALATALGGVLGDAARSSRLGASARRTIEQRFAIANTAARYVETYRELAASARTPGAAR